MLPSLPKKSGTSQGKGVDDCYRGGHDRGRRQDPIVLNFDITISWWKTVGFWIGNHHNMQLMLLQIRIQFHQKWITSLNFFLQSYLLSSFIKVSLSFLIFFLSFLFLSQYSTFQAFNLVSEPTQLLEDFHKSKQVGLCSCTSDCMEPMADVSHVCVDVDILGLLRTAWDMFEASWSLLCEVSSVLAGLLCEVSSLMAVTLSVLSFDEKNSFQNELKCFNLKQFCLDWLFIKACVCSWRFFLIISRRVWIEDWSGWMAWKALEWEKEGKNKEENKKGIEESIWLCCLELGGHNCVRV